MASPRLPAPERRAAIIEAAIKLFSEKGFRGGTTRELAHSVGVSEPVLYQHFPSKRDLYQAIIEKIAETSRVPWGNCILPSAVPGESDREFFTAIARALIQWHELHPAYIRLLIFSGLEGSELGELFFSRFSSAFFDALAQHIRKRVESGAFRDIDPSLAAHHFIGLIAHWGINFALCNKAHISVLPEDAIRSMVDVFLKGVEF